MSEESMRSTPPQKKEPTCQMCGMEGGACATEQLQDCPAKAASAAAGSTEQEEQKEKPEIPFYGPYRRFLEPGTYQWWVDYG